MAAATDLAMTLTVVVLVFLVTVTRTNSQAACNSLDRLNAAIKIGNSIYVFHNSIYFVHNQNGSAVADPDFRVVSRRRSQLFPGIPALEITLGAFDTPDGNFNVVTGASPNITNVHTYRPSAGPLFTPVSVQPLNQLFRDLQNIPFVNFITQMPNRDRILIGVTELSANSRPTTNYIVYSAANLARIQTIRAQHPTVPTSVTMLDNNMALATFNPFYAIVSFNGPEDFATNANLQVNRNNFRSTSPWLTCPPEVCYDIDFDATSRGPGITPGAMPIYMAFVDDWVVTFSSWPPNNGVNAKTSIVFPGVSVPLDAVFDNGPMVYLVRGTQTYMYNVRSRTVRTEQTSTIFGYDNLDIKGASSVNDDLILFIGCCWYQTFKMTTELRFTTDGIAIPLTIFNGLPRDIDAALTDNQGFVWIFKNQYYFPIPAAAIIGRNSLAVTPFSVFFGAFDCTPIEDQVYAPLQNVLGINNHAGWLDYTRGVRPIIALEDQDIPVTSPRPTRRRPTGQPGPEPARSPGSNTAIIVLVLLLLMASVIGVLAYFFASKHSHENMISAADTVFPTIQTVKSQTDDVQEVRVDSMSLDEERPEVIGPKFVTDSKIDRRFYKPKDIQPRPAKITSSVKRALTAKDLVVQTRKSPATLATQDLLRMSKSTKTKRHKSHNHKSRKDGEKSKKTEQAAGYDKIASSHL